MTSFLGVPITARGAVYGILYLTDKVGWSEFTNDDQALVEALAIAAGIAIENARLHQQVQRVAVLEDRDRLARDLHDTVIQHLFGIGLSLQSLASVQLGDAGQERLRDAVTQIDATISQIRTTIYGLGVVEPGASVRSQLVALSASSRARPASRSSSPSRDPSTPRSRARWASTSWRSRASR